MSPAEVKAKIILLGKSQAAIAVMAGVSRAAITMIIQRKGKSRRLQELIAREIGMRFDEVWGEIVA
jgi:lambda repressor-like predicted transcriptional regulator